MSRNPHKLSAEELAFFRAFDNEIRLEILKALEVHERCVNEIVKELDCDQTTVSHNLRFLSECGFVEVKRKGKTRVYSLSSPSIEKIFDLMEEHFERTRKLLRTLRETGEY